MQTRWQFQKRFLNSDLAHRWKYKLGAALKQTRFARACIAIVSRTRGTLGQIV
jgi:hypothetical protein